MRILRATFLLLVGVFLVPSLWAGTLPLERVFPQMDNRCTPDSPLTQRTLHWLLPNDSGQLVNAPPPDFEGHISSVRVIDEGEFWVIETQLHDSTFKGLPVTRLDRWAGKGDGVSGYALVFTQPFRTVQHRLKTRTVTRASEITLPQLGPEQNTGRAVLTCDFSD